MKNYHKTFYFIEICICKMK